MILVRICQVSKVQSVVRAEVRVSGFLELYSNEGWTLPSKQS